MVTVSGRELQSWRKTAIKQAIAAKVPVKEVDWLLQQITTLDSLTLRLESFVTNSAIAITYSLPELSLLWQKRLQEHLPIQYLVGKTNWRNWELQVSPAVLIPRPETELVVEIVRQLKFAPTIVESEQHWVDLGTGSGAIAISLAASFPQAKVHAVDISEEALVVARKNAGIAGFAEQISFYHGSWWTPLQHLEDKVIGMVANPPYIPTVELPQLQPEVFHHEPHLALDGGKDGLEAIRHLVSVSPQYLRSGGVWFSEIMAGQAAEVIAMLEDRGSYRNIEAIRDLAGIERFVLARRK